MLPTRDMVHSCVVEQGGPQQLGPCLIRVPIKNTRLLQEHHVRNPKIWFILCGLIAVTIATL